MDKLPNGLSIALAALIYEQNVIQWNIHSNGNIVNVTTKFAMSGYVAVQSSMPQPQVNSAMNKSPAQQRRDDTRGYSIESKYNWNKLNIISLQL